MLHIEILDEIYVLGVIKQVQMKVVQYFLGVIFKSKDSFLWGFAMVLILYIILTKYFMLI